MKRAIVFSVERETLKTTSDFAESIRITVGHNNSDSYDAMATTHLRSNICNNETLEIGYCYGMPVCGFCYNFGQPQKTKEYEIYNLIIIGIVLPIMVVFGSIGNSISAFIYSRKNMHSSLNAYLCALAFSDIIIASTSIFLFSMESLRKRSALISKYFALLAPIMFPLGLTAQSLSVFLTIAAAFDCFVLVITPQRHCCTVRTSKRAIIYIVLAACCFNFTHIFEINVISCWSEPYNMPSYDVCPTALRQNEIYYKLYYVYLYTIVMAVGPVLLLIILNSFIIFSFCYGHKKEVPHTQIAQYNHKAIITQIGDNCLTTVERGKHSNIFKNHEITTTMVTAPKTVAQQQSFENDHYTLEAVVLLTAATPAVPYVIESQLFNEKRLSRINSIDNNAVDQRIKENNALTASIVELADGSPADIMTLVLVVCLFISCNILPLAVNFLELTFNLVNSYLFDLSNLMVVFNASFNFFIYYAFNRPFRAVLFTYLQQWRVKWRISHEIQHSV